MASRPSRSGSGQFGRGSGVLPGFQVRSQGPFRASRWPIPTPSRFQLSHDRAFQVPGRLLPRLPGSRVPTAAPSRCRVCCFWLSHGHTFQLTCRPPASHIHCPRTAPLRAATAWSRRPQSSLIRGDAEGDARGGSRRVWDGRPARSQVRPAFVYTPATFNLPHSYYEVVGHPIRCSRSLSSLSRTHPRVRLTNAVNARNCFAMLISSFGMKLSCNTGASFILPRCREAVLMLCHCFQMGARSR